MGVHIPFRMEDDSIELWISGRFIKKYIPTPVEKQITYETETYVYGGGGILTTPEGLEIPRGGVSGRLPMPADLTMTHIKRAGRWVEIPEKPTLHPRTWSSKTWRSGIPISIRYKYRILPGMPVRATYSKYVTEFIVPIYNLGKTYYARWDGERKSVVWTVPERNECFEAVKAGFDVGVAPNAECHFELDGVHLDVLFSPFAGKIVSGKLRYAYRNMAVRNYTATAELDYPFLAEIRAFYLTPCAKDFYQEEDIYMTLLDALRITILNMVLYFFTPAKEGNKYSGLSYAEKIKGAVSFTAKPITAETLGEEKNVKVHFGEAEPWPFGKAVKYVRVVNEQSFKRKKGPYVYHNDIIESTLKTNPYVDIDRNGFVWEKK